MTIKRATTVTRGTADSYRIRTAQGEYAIVYIEHGKDQRRPDTWWGSITSHGSFGTYGTYWASCGSPFPKFLAGLDFDYAMKNLRDYKHREFDVSGTILNIKREIIEDRRHGGYSKKVVREAWDALMSTQEWDSQDLFIRELMDSDCHYFSECYEWAPVHRYKPDCVGFWEQIWPLLIAELTEKVEQAA